MLLMKALRRLTRRPRPAALVGALLGLLIILSQSLLPCFAQFLPGDDRATGQQRPQHQQQGGPEAASRALCEAEPDRIFVQHILGTECIVYVMTAAPVETALAVFYFHGDLTARELQQPDFTQKHIARLRPALTAIAAREKVRFIYVARPGVLGSSGNHGGRWAAKEMLSMNAAVDVLKTRHGLQSIVVAGQSGGSTIAAAMLTLGRRDIACAVLGSGALMLTETVAHIRALSGAPPLPEAVLKRTYFDPGDRVPDITLQPSRRIFILGDPIDARTPFALQRQFADRLKAFGHHAVVVEVVARGETMHGVAHLTLPVAAHCALGLSDSEIIDALATAQVASPTPHDRPSPGLEGGARDTDHVPR